jgi:hypothetical protein
MCCNLRVIAKNLAWLALIFALLLSVLKGLFDQKIRRFPRGRICSLKRAHLLFLCQFKIAMFHFIRGQEIDTQMRAKKLLHSLEQ